MDAFDVVRQFEKTLAEFAGSKYAVCIDSCSNALLLCCLYQKGFRHRPTVIPKRTYVSVPCAVLHAGGILEFEDLNWQGVYYLKPWSIVDGAKRFRPGMYEPGTLHCLSFHAKKRLAIGRGGAILTDDEEAVRWLKLARFDGREEGVPLSEQSSFDVVGWNFYMTPEQAARGLLLMSMVKDYSDLSENPPYPDLSIHPAFRRI